MSIFSEISSFFNNGESAADTEKYLDKTAIEANLSPRDIQRAVEFIKSNEKDNAFQTVEFKVLGKAPVAKRPRASRIRDRTGAVTGIRMHAADGGAQKTLKGEIVEQLPQDFKPFCGEVILSIRIYRPFLSNWPPYKQFLAEIGYIRPDTKPDYDNYAKIITDAMREVVFIDDSLVVIGEVGLFFSDRPRLEITVSGRKISLTGSKKAAKSQ